MRVSVTFRIVNRTGHTHAEYDVDCLQPESGSEPVAFADGRPGPLL